MSRRPRAAAMDERGFALLMVLWALMLLAFLATVFAGNTRTEVLLARNLLVNAQAEALADAGVFRAVAGLNREPSNGGFHGDGRLYIWATPDGEVRFSVRDEGGKIDLNQASDVLLRELFVVLGVEPTAAAELADAIIDFRDEDDDKQPNGAEERQYRSLGLPFGPKNQPFELAEELAYVPGVTPQLFARLMPLITVHGELDLPNEFTAPPEVRTAVAAAERAPQRGSPLASSAFGSTGSSRASSFGENKSAVRGGSGFGDRGASGRSSFGTSSGRSGFGSGSTSFGSGSSSFGSGSSSFGFGSSSSGSGFRSRSVVSLGAEDAEAGLAGELGTEGSEERSGVPVFTVHAEARTVDGTVFVREATIDFAGADDAPFAIVAWRQGQRRLFAAPGDAPSTEAGVPAGPGGAGG